MIWIVIRSILFGMLGLVVMPVVVFMLVLVVGYAFDPRCGTPGDSGGCEMSAATIAISALPIGFLGGFLVSLILGLRARRRA